MDRNKGQYEDILISHISNSLAEHLILVINNIEMEKKGNLDAFKKIEEENKGKWDEIGRFEDEISNSIKLLKYEIKNL